MSDDVGEMGQGTSLEAIPPVSPGIRKGGTINVDMSTMTAGYPYYIPGNGSVGAPTTYNYYILFTGAMGWDQNSITGWSFKSNTAQTWYALSVLQNNLLTFGNQVPSGTDVWVGPNDYFNFFLPTKTIADAANALSSMISYVNLHTPAGVDFHPISDAECYSGFANTLSWFQDYPSCAWGGAAATYPTEADLRQVFTTMGTTGYVFPQLYNPAGSPACSGSAGEWNWYPADSSVNYFGMQIDPTPYSTNCCCVLQAWEYQGHSVPFVLFDWASPGKATCDNSGV